MSLQLTLLPDPLVICRLPPSAPLPGWAFSGPLASVTRTPDELSVVCAEAALPAVKPAQMQTELGWRALAVAGPLDFSLTGILASLTAPLAAAGIPVFALSTYDTDYLLVRQPHLPGAIQALRDAEFQVSD